MQWHHYEHCRALGDHWQTGQYSGAWSCLFWNIFGPNSRTEGAIMNYSVLRSRIAPPYAIWRVRRSYRDYRRHYQQGPIEDENFVNTLLSTSRIIERKKEREKKKKIIDRDKVWWWGGGTYLMYRKDHQGSHSREKNLDQPIVCKNHQGSHPHATYKLQTSARRHLGSWSLTSLYLDYEYYSVPEAYTVDLRNTIFFFGPPFFTHGWSWFVRLIKNCRCLFLFSFELH